MSYVDGFVLAVPKKNLDAYRRIAQKAGKIWREHGALEYRECVGDDLDVKNRRSVYETSQDETWRNSRILVYRI